jgi:tight adherence protein B
VTLAVGAAVLAVLALVPARPRLAARVPRWPPWSRAAAVVVALAGALGHDPRLVLLAGVAAGVGVGGSLLWRARNRRRAAQAASYRVLETCELLAAELSAGQPPGRALDRAALAWPPLAPVAEAFRVGADVPTAFRHLAAVPGCGDLRLVAAAWQVAHRTGQGLGQAVDAVADGLRGAATSRRVVEGELASARATARLVGGLPVLTLAMGNGAGGDPWRFLFGHPVGLACLAGGLAFGLAGLAWIEAIARDVDRDG